MYKTRIEHTAVWVRDIERTRDFFQRNFNATSGARYDNDKGFSSYFMSFPGCTTRLEIMQSSIIEFEVTPDFKPSSGMGHIAVGVGSKEKVDSLTDSLISEGHRLLSGPRVTGDGYYESCLAVFNDFMLEITV